MEMWREESLPSSRQRLLAGYHQEQLMAVIMPIGEGIHAHIQNDKRTRGGEFIFKQYIMSIKLR